MKVKILTHNPTEYVRERKQDVPKMHHNPDKALHPFEKAREITRALNAVKLERLFSKPFLGSLEGHIDGVYCMAKHLSKLNLLASGSADGELRLWDLGSRKTSALKTLAHSSFVRGLAFVQNSSFSKDKFLSCSDDCSIKLWSPSEQQTTTSTELGPSQLACLSTWSGSHPFTAIDHHYNQNLFASSGSAVHIWSHDKASPIQTFEWGHATLTAVKFNVTDVNVLAACATDRSISLYDLRTSSALSKVSLAMRSNAISWNPMEAFNFTVANEDHCCYTFDMRKLDKATNILKDHVSAVLDLDYSPTGQEIVTGAYDRSLRIYNSSSGHSRDVYHTKRMQKIFCVKFSMDSQFVFCGSDDGNIRLWRAHASHRFGYKNPRQKENILYSKALQNKYSQIPEIKRISKHRLVPKAISSAQREKRIIQASKAKREENQRKHSHPSSLAPFTNSRKAPIVSIEK